MLRVPGMNAKSKLGKLTGVKTEDCFEFVVYQLRVLCCRETCGLNDYVVVEEEFNQDNVFSWFVTV